MRRALLWAVLLSCAATARAEDGDPAPGAGPAAPTAAEIAQDVLAAVGAKDTARLSELALGDVPDPWLVADALCARGEGSAAKAFAAAAPRPDTERLAAAVAASCGDARDAPVRAAVEAAQAQMERGAYSEAVGTLDRAVPPAATIAAAAWADRRAFALDAAGRGADAETAWGAAAAAAGALGWRRLEADALRAQGTAAYRRGDAAKALERWQACLAVHEARHDDVSCAGLRMNVGFAHRLAGDLPAAVEALRAALGGFRTVGDVGGVVAAGLALGDLSAGQGDLDGAGAAYEEALGRAQVEGYSDETARALVSLAEVDVRRGARRAARARLERAAALLGEDPEANLEVLAGVVRQLGRVRSEDGDREGTSLLLEALELSDRAHDTAGACLARIELGADELRRGDWTAAGPWLSDALDAATKAGLADVRARALGYLGAAADASGDLRKALRLHGQALEVFVARRAAGPAAVLHAELADLWRRLGENARAEDELRLAAEQAREASDVTVDVAVATHLANLRWSQGRLDEALTGHERAGALAEKAGMRGAVAVAATNVGAVQLELDDPEAAKEALSKALPILEALGHRREEIAARVNLAALQTRTGNPRAALSTLARARALAEGARDASAVAVVSLGRAEAERRLGHADEARRLLERVELDARTMRDDALTVHALAAKSQLALERGEAAVALEVAKNAFPLMERVLRSYGGDEGAIARSQYADLYDAGVRAAMAVPDPERPAAPGAGPGATPALGDAGQVVAFLESGRAGSLLEALGGRDALDAASIDPPLRLREVEARAKETAARRAYAEALPRGDRRELGPLQAELDRATQAVQDAVSEIQRARKSASAASVFYPRAATLPQLEALLRPGDALVLYGFTTVDAVAVVVTRGEPARCVRLGTAAEVRDACAALSPSEEDVPWEPAGKALEKLVVGRLGLGPDVTRVLVSPDGPLAATPPALLFGERAVVYLPSGTTYRVLREDEAPRGEQVLAFGDPDYWPPAPAAAAGTAPAAPRKPRFDPLPGTKAEAAAVGDEVVLGRDFTIAGIRGALARKPRWRSVLLACHGRADPVRPWLSSLFVTAGESDEGRLLARDVALLRIPADLVVLSACQTGLGRVVRAEGLLGMARAVMVAGSPRVVASLWKVDDAATEAFIRAFYGAWNPKDGGAVLPAAEALRRAQASVRSKSQWTHPKYWAAWVLWGLPD